MPTTNPGRPVTGEYGDYYSQYIKRVPDGDIVAILTRQLEAMTQLLTPLSTEQLHFRPKPDDWNMLEVLGHISDGERVFAYRALRVSRNDPTPLPGFDQDLFVANADFSDRSLGDLLDEFTTVRRASISLFRTLSAEAWLRKGTASDNPISPRALAYIIAGHELHHVADFQQRYRVS